MLTDKQKAAVVLASQGYASGLLDSLSEPEFADLVAMHGTDGVQVKFAAWLDEYRESRKATVDED